MKGPYKSGKSQRNLYTGGVQGYDKSNSNEPTHIPHDRTTTPDSVTHLPIDTGRYQQPKDPLRRAMGVHGSTQVSAAMASKYIAHPDKAVRKQAQRIAGKKPESKGN